MNNVSKIEFQKLQKFRETQHEEMTYRAEGNLALNISAQLVTALPVRESGSKLNQPLEQRNRKQPPQYSIAYINL